MTMTGFEQFVVNLADAYEHLYDLVYLRTHPLQAILFGDTDRSAKDNAWQFHHALLNTIQELDPGPQAPTFSREWRRHRLMVLRYIDGQSPQAVADQLAISRRHYYREHEGAIEALAQLFWRRSEVADARESSDERADAPPSIYSARAPRCSLPGVKSRRSRRADVASAFPDRRAAVANGWPPPFITPGARKTPACPSPKAA